jgi:hypothetical protein
MHIEMDKLELLEKEFKVKYGRNLIGKGMGQFHSDFESSLGEVLYAEGSTFLGKKCYIDKLVVKTKTGEIVSDYHIRMRGVCPNAVIAKVNRSYNGDFMKLYDDLYDGVEVEFDLADG